MWKELIQTNIKVQRINDNTWVISEGEGRGKTHSYILEGNSNALIIDTGLHVFNLKQIVSKLTNKDVLLLNTHGHLDHITNNNQFDSVYLHPDDYEVYVQHSNKDIRKSFFIQRLVSKKFPTWLLQLPFVGAYLKMHCDINQNYNIKKVFDGEVIDLGGRKLEIIHTPGHTRGSICILDEKEQALYTGDSLCEDAVLLNFEHSTPVSTFVQSLKKLKRNENKFNKIYAGHQKLPLEVDIIDDYINCAKTILKGSDVPVVNESSVGKTFRSTYGKATIAYSVNKKKKVSNQNV